MIQTCKLTVRLQCLDIALLAWFFPLVLSSYIQAYWLCLGQIILVSRGILTAAAYLLEPMFFNFIDIHFLIYEY